MTGQIRLMIDKIIATRAKGNPTIAATTRTKLILKGVNPERHSATSVDDEPTMAKLRAIAAELGVQL